MEAFGLLLHGFAVLLTWKTLVLMMVGLVLGIFVGVLPGLGGPNGVAILLPLTFTMLPPAHGGNQSDVPDTRRQMDRIRVVLPRKTPRCGGSVTLSGIGIR